MGLVVEAVKTTEVEKIWPHGCRPTRTRRKMMRNENERSDIKMNDVADKLAKEDPNQEGDTLTVQEPLD